MVLNWRSWNLKASPMSSDNRQASGLWSTAWPTITRFYHWRLCNYYMNPSSFHFLLLPSSKFLSLYINLNSKRPFSQHYCLLWHSVCSLLCFRSLRLLMFVCSTHKWTWDNCHRRTGSFSCNALCIYELV